MDSDPNSNKNLFKNPDSDSDMQIILDPDPQPWLCTCLDLVDTTWFPCRGTRRWPTRGRRSESQ